MYLKCHFYKNSLHLLHFYKTFIKLISASWRMGGDARICRLRWDRGVPRCRPLRHGHQDDGALPHRHPSGKRAPLLQSVAVVKAAPIIFFN